MPWGLQQPHWTVFTNAFSDTTQHPFKVFYRCSCFLVCRNLSFPKPKSEKVKKLGDNVNLFFFPPKMYWLKNPWHTWFFYLRYLPNIFWKHRAPSCLNHNKINYILEYYESEFKPQKGKYTAYSSSFENNSRKMTNERLDQEAILLLWEFNEDFTQIILTRTQNQNLREHKELKLGLNQALK